MKLSLIIIAVLFPYFGTGATVTWDRIGPKGMQIEIPFVTIGATNNAQDSTGHWALFPALKWGAVPYYYRVSVWETPEKWIKLANLQNPSLHLFLKCRGSDDELAMNKFCNDCVPQTLYCGSPTWPASSPGGTTNHIHPSWGDMYPACHMANVTNIIVFVNWLNTASGNQKAYDWNGTNASMWPLASSWVKSPGVTNRYRHKNCKYFLLDSDEWYKAGHYNPNTATYQQWSTGTASPTPINSGSPGTATNTAPIKTSPYTWCEMKTQFTPCPVNKCGGQSPWGTLGQTGNLHEIVETTDLSGTVIWVDRWQTNSFMQWGGRWTYVATSCDWSANDDGGLTGNSSKMGNEGSGIRIGSTP